MIIDEMM